MEAIYRLQSAWDWRECHDRTNEAWFEKHGELHEDIERFYPALDSETAPGETILRLPACRYVWNKPARHKPAFTKAEKCKYDQGRKKGAMAFYSLHDDFPERELVLAILNQIDEHDEVLQTVKRKERPVSCQ